VSQLAADLRFRLLCADARIVDGTAVIAAGMCVTFAGDVARLSLASIGTDAYEIRAVWRDLPEGKGEPCAGSGWWGSLSFSWV
jgi:hypothetical protein